MYRTYTYIAFDGDIDYDAYEQLLKWNESNHCSISFKNAHDLRSARDTSLNCNIEKSLKERLDTSKTFILIIGNKTKDLRAGGCQYCKYYKSDSQSCEKGYSVDYNSYIDYEIQYAVDKKLNIILLYNGYLLQPDDSGYDTARVVEQPEPVKNYFITAMKSRDGGWDYQKVKTALGF